MRLARRRRPRGLTRLSQLAQHAPGWRAAFGYEFLERADEYSGLAATYELRFREPPRVMDLTLIYRALAEGQVDVVAGDATAVALEGSDVPSFVGCRRQALGGPPRTSSSAVFPTGMVEEIMRSEATMDVHLEIPEELARQLASDASGLARAALEAIALEGVRSGKLTVSQARRLLGIQSRYEMDGFLKAHGVFLDLTLEDVRRDSEAALTSSR